MSKSTTENSMFNLNFINKTFLQALTFGVVTVILGILFMAIFGVFKPELPQECNKWNKYYVFEMTQFLIGFSLRYILEIIMAKSYLCDI